MCAGTQYAHLLNLIDIGCNCITNKIIHKNLKIIFDF